MKVARSESHTPKFFCFKSRSEKNMLKTFNSISLTHADSYVGTPSVMSIPIRGGVIAIELVYIGIFYTLSTI